MPSGLRDQGPPSGRHRCGEAASPRQEEGCPQPRPPRKRFQLHRIRQGFQPVRGGNGGIGAFDG